MKRRAAKANPIPLGDRCQRCGSARRKHFVIIRAATQDFRAELCTRCTNAILVKYPASEAAQMIETKAGAN